MKNNALYITGHRNPDTDSICSAIAYAYLKQTQMENAVAIRAGELNEETKFILDYFNEDAPPLVRDMRTRVRDIDFDDAITINSEGMINEALQLMAKYNKKVVAIVTENRHLLGMATISDIANSLVDTSTKKIQLIKNTPISNISKILDGNLCYESLENRRDGNIRIATSVEKDFKASEYTNRIVITSSRIQSQINVIKGKAAVVIATKTDEINPAILELAKQYDCTYITTKHDMFTASQLIDKAIPLKLIMTSDLTGFKYDEYLDDVKVKINKSRFRSYPVLDASNRLVGLISRYHLFKHVNRRLVLVDHNEINQSVAGAEQAEVVEIIDHHRIGGLQTNQPIYFRNDLVGSCSTIIAKIFEEQNVPMPKNIAGLLCSAIISDTVYFHSPTCRQVDIATCYKLAELAGVNIEELAPQILKASTSLTDKSAEDIVYNDLKVFDIESYRVAIGQIYIMDLDSIKSFRKSVLDYLDQFRITNKFDYCLMVFSLIDASGSYCLDSYNDFSLLQVGFDLQYKRVDEFYYLENVISRKLQIVPNLTVAAKIINENHSK